MLKINTYLFVSILILCSPSFANSNNSNKSILSNFNVMQLLEQDKYDQLENHFTKLIIEYHANTIDERVLYDNFEIFQNSGTEFGLNLENWLKLYPDSIAAKLALARHYLHRGWLSRGANWKSKTRNEQFEGMGENFIIALKYYLELVDQDPAMILTYCGMMSIAMAMGDEEWKDNITKQALAAHPDSYIFNFKRLFAMQPKWGGEIKSIQKVITELEPLFESYPKLELIKGFEAYAVANDITKKRWSKKSCASAASLLDKAIALYPDEYLYIGRAKYYRCMGKYKEAVSDSTTALEISPFNYHNYLDRGYSYFYIDEYEKSIEDLSVAISLDNLNPKALQYRGMSYYYSNHYDKARKDFIASLVYGDYKNETHRMLGYIYHDQLKDYVKAEEEFYKAIKYGDSRPKTLLMLVSSQHQQKDCKFVPTAKTYIDLCKSDNHCKEKNIAWAKDSILHVQSEGTCP